MSDFWVGKAVEEPWYAREKQKTQNLHLNNTKDHGL